MKRLFVMVVVTMMATVIIHAQIDPQVIEVLKKSQEKMSNPLGTEIEMTIDVTLMVKLTGMTIKCSEKNNKIRLFMDSKVMGQELMVETGFDGQQEWRYMHRKDDEDDPSSQDSRISSSEAPAIICLRNWSVPASLSKKLFLRKKVALSG